MNETERIVAIRTNEISDKEREDLVQVVTRNKRGAELRETQVDSLVRIKRARGGLIAAGVGHGKFLISALAPVVLESSRALLLVPAGLLEQTKMELDKWRGAFRIPCEPYLRVLSYSQLSTVSGRFALRDYQPDLIIADECHKIRRLESARTKRVIDYYQKNPSTRFVGLSGTMTARSLKDFNHLAELALRELSPLPRTWRSMRAWTRLIDVRSDERPTPADHREIAPLLNWAKDTRPREAFRARFVSSPGVLATTSSAFEGSLEVYAERYKTPDSIRMALETLETRWRTPDGQDLASALDVARVRRQLSAGYWLRWEWPDGIIDFEWLDARREWMSAVRRYLKSNRSGVDSILLAERAENKPGYLESAFVAWTAVKDRPAPPVVAEIVDRKPLETALEVASKLDRPSLIWSESPRTLSFYQEERSVKSYAPGDVLTLEDRGKQTIALSRRSHGTGLNLDDWSSNILVGIPASATTFEQVIGRSHRPGQREDSVEVRIVIPDCISPARALAQLRRDAAYLESVSGQSTKVLSARWIAFDS